MSKVLLIFLLMLTTSVVGLADEDVLRPEGRSDGYSSSSSSKKFAVGLEGGLTYNMFSADLTFTNTTEEPSKLYDVFESVDGLSPHLGIFIDYSFDDIFGIHLKVLYNSVEYEGSETADQRFVDPFTGQLLTTDPVTFTYNQQYDFLNIEPMLRISPIENLYFLVGPSIRLAISNIETNYNFTKPDESGITFLNNAYEVDEYMIHNSSDNYGLNLGLGYQFDVSNNVYIAPQIIFTMSLSEMENLDETLIIDSENSRRILSQRTLNQLRFSLAVWFDKAF